MNGLENSIPLRPASRNQKYFGFWESLKKYMVPTTNQFGLIKVGGAALDLKMENWFGFCMITNQLNAEEVRMVLDGVNSTG